MQDEKKRPNPLERAEQYSSDLAPEYVVLDEGELIGGEIIDIDLRDTKFGTDVPVILFRTPDDEEVELWCNETVLRNEIEKREPQPGETIAVKRLTDAKNGAGSLLYKRYKVFDDRARRINWKVQRKLRPEDLPEHYEEQPGAETGTLDAFQNSEPEVPEGRPS